MRFLEVASSYLGGRNMSGYGENGCPRPVTVVQAVDEMEVAWPATARTNGETPCQLHLGACGEGSRIFMQTVDPFDGSIPTDFLSNRVERISNDAVDPPNSSLDQNLHQFRCYRVGHPCAPWSTVSALRGTPSSSQAGLACFLGKPQSAARGDLDSCVLTLDDSAESSSS